MNDPWKFVRTSGNKKQFNPNPTTLPNVPSSPVNPRTKQPGFQNKQVYTLRFTKDAPYKGIQTPPHIAVDKVNIACKKNYKIRAILAKWTKVRNLTITFRNDSKDKDIENASNTIINTLAPDHNNVSFSKPTIWNKIVYRSVPCRAHTVEAFDGDDMQVNDTWDKERLLIEVKNSHPLLANAEFAYTPDWTTAHTRPQAKRFSQRDLRLD